MLAFLVFLGALVTWVAMWRLMLRRCAACGQPRWLAHGLGAMTGAGAAVVALVFALSLKQVVMTGHGYQRFCQDVQIIVGTLIACAWAFGWHRRIACPALVRAWAACAGAQIGRAWAGVLGQTRRVAQALRAGCARFMHHIDRQAGQAAVLRAEREAALGMSFGAFALEREAAHFTIWLWVAFMAAWGGFFWLFRSASHELGWFMPLLLSFVLTTVAGVVVMSGFLVTFLVIQSISDTLASIFLLILLPFPLLSIWLEARWRIRYRRPYTRPPVTELAYDHYGSSGAAEAAPASCGALVLALALGFLLGSAWAGDDD